MLLASEKAIKDYGLTPLARFVGFAVAGVPPEVMGIGPKAAIPKVCKQTGIRQDDLDWIELNEAFSRRRAIRTSASTPTRSILSRRIAPRPSARRHRRVRIATLVTPAPAQLKYGMVTMCIGTGMGAAGIFERV